MKNELKTELASAVIDSIAEAVYVVDRERRIVLWNEAAERLTGFSSDEVVGSCCRDGILQHVDEAGEVLCGSQCPLQHVMSDGRAREVEAFFHHRDGHRQPVRIRASALRAERNGEIIGATEVFSDNSDVLAVRQRLAELEAQALTDPLTGLANRRYLTSELRAWLSAWQRERQRFGVLFIDVDHFKRLNDRFGHELGDRALRMVAQTLAYAVRAHDVVARWGGEEFVVLVQAADPASLERAAERLRVLVGRSQFAVTNTNVAVTVSIGGALVEAGEDSDSLLRRADDAMYRAKTQGRNCVQLASSAADAHFAAGEDGAMEEEAADERAEASGKRTSTLRPTRPDAELHGDVSSLLTLRKRRPGRGRWG